MPRTDDDDSSSLILPTRVSLPSAGQLTILILVPVTVAALMLILWWFMR